MDVREGELVALAETLGLEIAVWSTLFEGDAPLVYKPVNPIRRAHLLFSGAHYDLIVARATSGAGDSVSDRRRSEGSVTAASARQAEVSCGQPPVAGRHHGALGGGTERKSYSTHR